MDTSVDGDLVVAAAQILHERVTGRDGTQRPQGLQSAHRPQPSLEPTVVGFHRVVRVLLEDAGALPG